MAPASFFSCVSLVAFVLALALAPPSPPLDRSLPVSSTDSGFALFFPDVFFPDVFSCVSLVAFVLALALAPPSPPLDRSLPVSSTDSGFALFFPDVVDFLH